MSLVSRSPNRGSCLLGLHAVPITIPSYLITCICPYAGHRLLQTGWYPFLRDCLNEVEVTWIAGRAQGLGCVAVPGNTGSCYIPTVPWGRKSFLTFDLYTSRECYRRQHVSNQEVRLYFLSGGYPCLTNPRRGQLNWSPRLLAAPNGQASEAASDQQTGEIG
jgi:hypothetical protein